MIGKLLARALTGYRGCEQVTDYSPLRISVQWKQQVAKSIDVPMMEVPPWSDGGVVVVVRARTVEAMT